MDDQLTSVGYLGPEATFTEMAMRQMPSVAIDTRAMPYPTVDAVLDAVRSGEVSAGVVPIENSLEGPVTSTLDALARDEAPLFIVEEWALPVRFSLLAPRGRSLSDVQRVASIPIAAAQCKEWLQENLPQAQLIAALSTAEAAASLTGDAATHDAAISAHIAAEKYHLDVLATDIGDNPDARTRFVLVRNPGPLPTPTGADKTTLMLYMREDHAGALMEILTEFAVRGVSLTWLQSRPTKKQLGDYYFSVDCEGHVDDARVGDTMKGLRRVCSKIRFLGSYPRHDGKESHTPIGTTDADFAEADSWLDRIRTGASG